MENSEINAQINFQSKSEFLELPEILRNLKLNLSEKGSKN